MVFNISQEEGLRTQESYLGNQGMAEAIRLNEIGSWPVGLEILTDILGRGGNMVDIEDMELLRVNHSELFTRVRKMCYAVRTCRPNPDAVNGGCTRTHRPGCQTYSSPTNIAIGFFRRGSGILGSCGDCPAGTPSLREETDFRNESIGLDDEKPNSIHAIDVLYLEITRIPGESRKMQVLLKPRHHRLKYNIPYGLERCIVEMGFTDLVIEVEDLDIDIDADTGEVVFDSPLQHDERVLEWLLLERNEDHPEYRVSIVPFSKKRIRFFVGETDISRSLQQFQERVPRGSAHDQRIRFCSGDSLLAWIPSLPDGNSESNLWQERLGITLSESAENLLTSFHGNKKMAQFEIFENYPGIFLFVKNSNSILSSLGGENSVRGFLYKCALALDHRSVIPQFTEDRRSIRFMWNKNMNPNSATDDGSKPLFVLRDTNRLDLLIQTSTKTYTDNDERTSGTHYPSIRVGSYFPNGDRSAIKHKLNPDQRGFAWCSLQFKEMGNYRIAFENTSTKMPRWISVIVLQREENMPEPITYLSAREEGFVISGSNHMWGGPSHQIKHAIFEANRDHLLSGMVGLIEALEIDECNSLSTGHVLEIIRWVFEHLCEGKSVNRIPASTLTGKVRFIIYTIEELFGLSNIEKDDILGFINGLGELEYWSRGEDFETHHRLEARPTCISRLPGRTDIVMLFDARSKSSLESLGLDSIKIDWETGLRFIEAKQLKILEPYHEVLVHPREMDIAPSASAWLISLWNAVEPQAKTVESDWQEYRWRIEGPVLPLSGLPTSAYKIQPVVNLLTRRVPIPNWLKKDDWGKASSIILGSEHRLFLSLLTPSNWDVSTPADPPWKLRLGSLNITNMEEQFIVIADSTVSKIIDLSWIDDLGRIGKSETLKLPWLADPKNSLYDSVYITRETVRAFASIILREYNPDGFTGLGLPAWSVQRDPEGFDLIKNRLMAAKRVIFQGETMLSSSLSTEHIAELTKQLKNRFWWGELNEN